MSILDPEILEFPTVRRNVQCRLTRLEVLVVSRPLHIHPRDIQLRQGLREKLPRIISTPHRWERVQRRTGDLLDHLRHDHRGADLDARHPPLADDPLFTGGAEGVEHLDGTSTVSDDKVGPQLSSGAHHPTAGGGDDGDARLGKGDALGCIGEGGEDGVDLLGVKGIGDVEGCGGDTPGLQLRAECLQVGLGSAEHGALTAVDAGDLIIDPRSTEDRLQICDVRADGEHRVATHLAETLQKLSPPTDEVDDIGLGEDTGGVEGGILSQTVADDGSGSGPERLPETTQSHLETDGGELHHGRGGVVVGIDGLE